MTLRGHSLNLFQRFAMATFNGECWEWPGKIGSDGYGWHYAAANKWVQAKAHREIFALLNGPIPKGMYVLHSCDNRKCIRPEHLRLGTPKDNMDDKYARGRANHARGERSGSAKLTEAQVRRVKFGGENIRDLSEEFGVHRQTLYGIRWGRIWKHVQ